MATDDRPRLTFPVLRLIDAGALVSTVDALRSKRLSQASGSATIGAVASGRIGVVGTLRILLHVWRERYPKSDGSDFADLIEAVAEGSRLQRESIPTTEVVWTGPTVEGSYLRATRQVVQDIIQGANHELLVVGYWIAGYGDKEDIIKDVIEQISDAVRRGVNVVIVLDSREKIYSKNNREVLLELWPVATDVPELFTWDVRENEKHLKLHAKVLVADRQDALVTSANLTMHALDRNMEMGVRVLGAPAGAIADHFDRLVENSILLSYGENE